MPASLGSMFLKVWLMPGRIFLHQAIPGKCGSIISWLYIDFCSRVVPAKAEFITAPVECNSVGRGLTLETEAIGYLDISNTR